MGKETVFTVKVYEDGRITIPENARKDYRVSYGDFVTLMLIKNNGPMNQIPKETST